MSMEMAMTPHGVAHRLYVNGERAAYEDMLRFIAAHDELLRQLKASQAANKELRDRAALLKFQAWHNRAALNAVHAANAAQRKPA